MSISIIRISNGYRADFENLEKKRSEKYYDNTELDIPRKNVKKIKVEENFRIINYKLLEGTVLMLKRKVAKM